MKTKFNFKQIKRFSSIIDYIYGRKAVLSVLASQAESKRKVKELYVSKNNINDKLLEKFIKDNNITVNLLEQTQNNKFQREKSIKEGFVIGTERRFYKPIKDINNFLAKKNDGSLILLLDQITDPQNFGNIIRSSIYLGVDSIVVNSSNKVPLSPSIAHISSGTSEMIDLYSCSDMIQFLKISSECGFKIITTGLKKSNKGKLEKNDKCVLVLGSEERGVSNLFDKYSTYNLLVESYGNKYDDLDSLNVGVSAGILINKIVNIIKAK